MAQNAQGTQGCNYRSRHPFAPDWYVRTSRAAAQSRRRSLRAGVLSPALMPRRSIHTVRLPWPGAGVATIALLIVPTGQKRKPCTDIREQSRHRSEQQPGKDCTHVLPDVQAGTWPGSSWQPWKADAPWAGEVSDVEIRCSGVHCCGDCGLSARCGTAKRAGDAYCGPRKWSSIALYSVGCCTVSPEPVLRSTGLPAALPALCASAPSAKPTAAASCSPSCAATPPAAAGMWPNANEKDGDPGTAQRGWRG